MPIGAPMVVHCPVVVPGEPVDDPEVEKVRVGEIDCDFVNEGEPDVVPVTD